MMKTLSQTGSDSAAADPSSPPAQPDKVELVPERHQPWWLRGLYLISFESRTAKLWLYVFIVVATVVATLMASKSRNPDWNSLPKPPASANPSVNLAVDGHGSATP